MMEMVKIRPRQVGRTLEFLMVKYPKQIGESEGGYLKRLQQYRKLSLGIPDKTKNRVLVIKASRAE